MLASIASGHESTDNGTQLLAAIVLKNTLRNHIVDIKQMDQSNGAHNELNCVKDILFSVLLKNTLNKRMQKELILVLTRVIL
jgi:hypothetical protein